ncbi:30S RIBOSOMAL PROTEIN S7 [Mycoplasmopsis pulmonis]|uniref:Small ribosomal subunit protein uS7 n=1 Tax=Mycoplasmopsis pulmonis (strain UAB CTIP) TaxID=272635 RepID=RS7_MYCPU|nr:30S ribosomal protein S7 [Mycoplasmopsis pulmonis]Q98QD7.1 RecName: Full=Small ribosomal subunit protein uS7; AltName: Full=30S ribosomal protein S7 [Mycoplasmopsis pulmonis UAB CTIP]MDZ7293698.1 30S ribosomal protein S7 [Mycoplasmopsis pulmonis]CAC13602.1 30S RIBOSOMAL PROTEIN S7 [Mycoplasmopsis pulmonis]VEU68191.1 30S ribosomal protein S7 [Mycoplasmopsis pulmonis]
MSRKHKAPIRTVLADPVFNMVVVTKLVNTIMLDGKKSIAQNIVYSAFDIIKEKTGREPYEVFQEALNNITPLLEIRTRRIGGSNYQVPTEVSKRRQQTLSLRWLTNYARLRNEKTMDLRLANEIIDASNKTGGAIKKREDTHKMAEANRAFAHFRW